MHLLKFYTLITIILMTTPLFGASTSTQPAVAAESSTSPAKEVKQADADKKAAAATVITPTKGHLRLLFIDTDGKKQYNYRNFIAMAKNAGFAPSYKSFYDFLESPTIDLNAYDAVFLLAGTTFFKNIKTQRTQQVLHALREFSSKNDTIFGLILPSIRYSDEAAQIAMAIATYLGFFSTMDGEIDKTNPARPIVQSFLRTLWEPDSQKGFVYGTTLFPAKPDTKPAQYTALELQIDAQNQAAPIAALLPRNRTGFSKPALLTIPTSLVIHNRETDSLYFISKSSEFLFADIEENFFRSPQHVAQRDELLEAAQQNMSEFYALCKARVIVPTDSVKRPAMPKELTRHYMAQQKQAINTNIVKAMDPKRYEWIKKEGVSCAWLTGTHDNDFFGALDALGNGVNFLYNAQFNLLWFEFNPEWYMLADGTRAKNQKEYIERITQIAQALKKKFAEHKKPLPKIFVGSDITSNYTYKKVQASVTDLYGQNYSKIPCPLDFDNFWKIELLDSLAAFIDAVKKDLPIDGIFLDLEMYHAQDQIAHYTDLMDYSDFAWNLFCKRTGNGELAAITDVNERVDALAQKGLLNTYINFLQQEMVTVAQKIKESIRKLLPNAMIAAYAMTLPASWFYRAIAQGLSSAADPLIFVTFNTDYFSHQQWLVDNNIHLFHGTVVMLSKLKNVVDFALIRELLQYHSFLWYNRASRKALPHDDKIWWALESTPMDADTLAQGIRENSKN